MRYERRGKLSEHERVKELLRLNTAVDNGLNLPSMVVNKMREYINIRPGEDMLNNIELYVDNFKDKLECIVDIYLDENEHFLVIEQVNMHTGHPTMKSLKCSSIIGSLYAC